MEYVPPYGSTDADAGYEDINQATATEGSPVPAAAIEHPMREIMAVIDAAGLTPSGENLSQLLEAMQVLFIANSTGLRTRLTADTTFYVATTGNDVTGNGTAGAPWATMQKAVDVLVKNYDFAGYTATVSIADGTYTSGVSIRNTVNGALILQGNTTTPANCIINPSTAQSCISADGNGIVSVAGFKLLNSQGHCGLSAPDGGKIHIIGAMDFGACTLAHIQIGGAGSEVYMSFQSYTISGGATHHMTVGNCGFAYAPSCTVTITNNPAFSDSFDEAWGNGRIVVQGSTFSGSATGSRYISSDCGTIYTGTGGSATYLPGNASGTVSTGGQYN